jgi:putative ABC transport system permease protein
MKYFALIWSGVWRKRGRAILMFLQLSVAFALFGTLQGMKTGVDQAIAAARADLLLVHSRVSSADPLPLGYLEHIEQVPGIKLVTGGDGFSATYQRPTQRVGVVAFNPDKTWPSAYPNFKVSPQALEAFMKTRTGTLVSVDLAQKYGWRVGDRIPLHSSTVQTTGSTDWAFDVVGIFSSDDGVDSSKGYIVINLAYFDEARLTGRGTVGRFNVVVSDAKQAAAVADEIDRRFANSSHETRTESLHEMAQTRLQSIGDLDFVIRAVVSAVLVALLFATATMMMQSIRERTPELAVLKAVGFTGGLMFLLITAEAALLCVAAAAFGLTLATLALPLADKVMPGLSMPRIVIVMGLAYALLIALLSVTLPASRVARLRIATALADR